MPVIQLRVKANELCQVYFNFRGNIWQGAYNIFGEK